MATRDLIRLRGQARRGDAAAQLKLGHLYLSGDTGLAPSMAAALIWLERAARQGLDAARTLIGQHVPIEAARRHGDPAFLLDCYRHAAETGSPSARIALACWLLDTNPPATTDAALCAKAADWARNAADAGNGSMAALIADAIADGRLAPQHPEEVEYYTSIAAAAGCSRATSQPEPHATAVILAIMRKPELAPAEARLLFQFFQDDRTRQALPSSLATDALQRAANAGLPEAQFHYGLWVGKFDDTGQRSRLTQAMGAPKVGTALAWLQRAANQGHAAAWYVLAMLHRNPRYTCHDHAQYLYCVHRAAQLGHSGAQLYLGRKLWRGRRSGLEQWTEAAYWLWRAAQASEDDARRLLPKAMECAPASSPWHPLMRHFDANRPVGTDQCMTLRIRLGALFGLNVAEALLIDPRTAQREHCLVVDISAAHPSHRPRLIMMETTQQRKCLLQLASLLEQAYATGEGDYEVRRERLGRLLEHARRNGIHLELEDAPQGSGVECTDRQAATGRGSAN